MAARKTKKKTSKPKRPSFSDAAGSAGVPRGPSGRPISTQTKTTKSVSTRRVPTRVVTTRPTGGPPPKRGPPVSRPSRGKGAVAQAAARAKKPPTRLQQIVKQIQDDPIGFALDNPRKPIRQAAAPPPAASSGNRQLFATTFRSNRQRKRRSAKVARRKKT